MLRELATGLVLVGATLVAVTTHHYIKTGFTKVCVGVCKWVCVCVCMCMYGCFYLADGSMGLVCIYIHFLWGPLAFNFLVNTHTHAHTNNKAPLKYQKNKIN